MKSGKKLPKVESTVSFHTAQYDRAHRIDSCDGGWVFTITSKTKITVDILGPISVAAAAFLRCEKCKAAYFAPGYLEFVEKVIAQSLVLSRELLSKKQLRFLRTYFDLTQDELAKLIKITDRHELSKMESESNSKEMSADKQLRLKIYYTKRMNLDPAKVFEFLEIDENQYCELRPDQLFTKKDVESLIKRTG